MWSESGRGGHPCAGGWGGGGVRGWGSTMGVDKFAEEHASAGASWGTSHETARPGTAGGPLVRPRRSPTLLAQWWAGCGRPSHTVQGTKRHRGQQASCGPHRWLATLRQLLHLVQVLSGPLCAGSGYPRGTGQTGWKEWVVWFWGAGKGKEAGRSRGGTTCPSLSSTSQPWLPGGTRFLFVEGC